MKIVNQTCLFKTCPFKLGCNFNKRSDCAQKFYRKVAQKNSENFFENMNKKACNVTIIDL